MPRTALKGNGGQEKPSHGCLNEQSLTAKRIRSCPGEGNRSHRGSEPLEIGARPKGAQPL